MNLFKSLFAVVALTVSAQAAPILRASSLDMRPECKYELVFDQAVVAEDVLNQPLENKWLTISPALPGKIIWTSRNCAEFLPDQAPKLDTKYQFSTPKNLTYADGKVIPPTQLLSITSPTFQIDYHRKNFKTNDRQPLSYVRFNDDISPDANQSLFSYQNKAGEVVPAIARQATWGDVESTYYIVPSWEKRFEIARNKQDPAVKPEAEWKNDDLISNGLVITPKEPLPIGKEWTLIANKGISSLHHKNKTLTANHYLIWDVDPFAIENVDPVVQANQPRKIYIEFNSMIDASLTDEQLAKLISISPKPANLKFKREGNNLVIAEGDFKTQSQWSVHINGDFQALNGLSLGKAHSQNIVFKHLRSGMSMPAFNMAQLAHGERSLSIDTLNLREVHIAIKKLNREQALRAQQGYRHYTGEGYDYQSIPNKTSLPFELISGETIYTKTITLDNPLDTTKEIPLLWNEILKSKDSSATLFVSVTGEPKNELGNKQAKRRIVQSIIQLTDIGLAWKFAQDKAWVYCYSLQTGNPIPNAVLSMVGEDSTLVSSAKTDATGLAVIPRSKADRHLIVGHENDQMMVAFDRTLDTVDMWHFPVDFSWSDNNFWQNNIMIFTDRSLYRPNEKVRMKGIVREFKDNEIRLSPYKNATLYISHNGKKLQEISLAISENGTFDHEFTLPAEQVGSYTYSVTLPESKDSPEARSTFTHSFSVQEFRRNAFEITSHLPETKPGDKHIQLDLTAKYYQGAPVATGKVAWYFTANQTGFYPDKFRDYLFCDHRDYDPYYWSHYFGYNDGSSSSKDSNRSNGNVSLDTNGAASVSLEIPAPEFPCPQRLQYFSEVTDSRDQTLTNTTSITHHSTNLYLGIARIDQLVRVNEEIPLNVVAVNRQGDYTGEQQTAQLTITREYNETVKIQSPDGKVTTNNENRTEELGKQEVTIPAGQPASVPFKTDKPGRYILQLTGTDAQGNKTSTASSFYVYGSDAYPWATEEGIKIKLVPEKNSYRPGDTAKILIMTPIEGQALITIERQGVLKTFKQELKIDNPVIEFPIEEGYAPNAYISVLVMRGASQSPHKHKEPALKLGYCSIGVDHPGKHLGIALQAPSESVRPGDETTLSGTVKDNHGKPVPGAEVVLFAEDEGTLAVMGYDDPKPFEYFHFPRPLTLSTGVSLSYFLDENPENRYIGNKGFIIGGGDGFGGDADNRLVAMRKNFDPCGFWAPSLVTDHDGNFKVSFTVPDTLTRYRVMAVALKSADRFGSANTTLVVNKDLMLEPKPPRFAHEGDQIQSKVLVQNTSRFAGTWEVTLRGDSLSKVDSSVENSVTKRIELAAGGSATLTFDVSFLNTGETKWEWSAKPVSLSNHQLDDTLRVKLSDAMENRFKVAYPRPLLREVAFFDHKAGAEPINLVEGISPALLGGSGHVDLEFSNSLLLEASGAADFLLHYPYGCAEQTTSSLMPWFAVRDLKQRIPGFTKKSKSEVATAIQKGVDRLLSMQTESGGLGYWPGDEEPTDWASAYGGMALVMAKEHGAQVPDYALENLGKHLSNYVKNKPAQANDTWFDDSQCQAHYVLAMLKMPEVAEQNKLFARRASLSSSSRAYLALAIHLSGGNADDATELLKMEARDVPTDHWMRYRADTPAMLLAWSTIAPQAPQAIDTMRQLLNSRNRQGHWNTTWVNGASMNAMAAYARNVENHLPDSTITLTTSAGSRSVSLSNDKPLVSLRLPLSEARELIASCDGHAYTRVAVSSKPAIAPNGPISKQGIAINRRYERVLADGTFEPLKEPKLGDLVRVSLSVTFPDVLDYVVIDDTLPSIMETVNNDFASQGSHVKGSADTNYNVSRMELRDDRAVFFLNRSWGRGTEELTYMARITATGTVHVPPAKVEAMYDPSRYGLSDTSIITVLP